MIKLNPISKLVLTSLVFCPEKEIEDDPEMIEMLQMLEKAKDEVEVAEEQVRHVSLDLGSIHK